MLMRFVRSATMQAVGQDYVRTAAAKGLTRNAALIRHGLPNVGLSVITVLGLQVAGIIVGAVVIEQLFSLPGIGRMLVADVQARDLPKVQGELLVLTGFVLHHRLRRRSRPPRDRPPAAGGDMTTPRGMPPPQPPIRRRHAVALGVAATPVEPVDRPLRAHRRRGRHRHRDRRALLDAVRPAAGRDRQPVGAPRLAAPARHGRHGSRHPEPAHGGLAHDRPRRGRRRRHRHRDRRAARRARRAHRAVAARIGRGPGRHPDRLPGPDHRDDDQRGVGRARSPS